MTSATKLPPDLEKTRARIDLQSADIVRGWEKRSRLLRNSGVFTQKFCRGKTWFERRLFREQDDDAEFGRFEYDDQHPIGVRKGELSAPIMRKRKPPEHGIRPANIEIDQAIIAFYQDLVRKITVEGEDPDFYGESAKLDVANVLAINERVSGMGMYVAEGKIVKDQTILKVTNVTELEKLLRSQTREDEVINIALKAAESCGFPHSEVVPEAFKRIIELTVAVELAYIVQLQKAAAPETISKLREMGVSCTGVGWGSSGTRSRPSGTGWR